MLNIALIKSRIAARAEEYLREFFGDRLHRAGAQSWRVGTRGSLALEIKDGELVFYDNEAGTGGDCFALWMRERGGTFADALKACAAWAGVSDDGAPSPAPASKPAVRTDHRLTSRPTRWPLLDDDHNALWRSGISRLIDDAGTRGQWKSA